MSDGSVIIDTVLNTKDFESGLSKMSSLASKGFSAISTAIKAVGTALAGAAAYSMKVGSDFEAQMSAVQAISGATGEEFDKLSEKAKQMGRDTKFTARINVAA